MVVRHHQHGRASLVRDLPKELHHASTAHAVECRCGLIRKNE